MAAVRTPPASESVAFPWLCTTAVREAMNSIAGSAAVGLDHALEVPAAPVLGPDGRLELIVAGEQVRAAQLRPREARVLGLRTAGYTRDEIAELTGGSRRTSTANWPGRGASWTRRAGARQRYADAVTPSEASPTVDEVLRSRICCSVDGQPPCRAAVERRVGGRGGPVVLGRGPFPSRPRRAAVRGLNAGYAAS